MKIKRIFFEIINESRVIMTKKGVPKNFFTKFKCTDSYVLFEIDRVKFNKLFCRERDWTQKMSKFSVTVSLLKTNFIILKTFTRNLFKNPLFLKLYINEVSFSTNEKLNENLVNKSQHSVPFRNNKQKGNLHAKMILPQNKIISLVRFMERN